MQTIPLILAALGFLASLRSAWLWYVASGVSAAPMWVQQREMEPVDSLASQQQWTVAIIQAGQAANELNGRGAVWTACAVVLSATSVLAT